MKHFFFLLLLLASLNAEKIFLLPEGYKDFLYSLKTHLQQANRAVYIVTSDLNEFQTSKTLRSLLESTPLKVSMVTSSDINNDATMLIKYKNFFLWNLPIQEKHPFSVHYMLMEPSNYCISSVAFNYKILKTANALAFCGNDKQTYNALFKLFRKLRERSHPYLPNRKMSVKN